MLMKKLKVIESEKRLRYIHIILQILTWLGIIAMCVLGYYLYKQGYLTDMPKLRLLVGKAGVWAPLLFMLLQLIQIILPVLPGGVTTLAGVVIFGPFWGFVWNYLSICVGSILAFHIAKIYGRPVLRLLFSPKTIVAYEKKTSSDTQFAKYFAIAIFFPFAPDDFLCYLAGTTSMTYKQFIWIILLGKPASILIYSLGLTTLFSKFFGF